MENRSGSHALIVEDEVLIVLELEEVLAMAGFTDVQAISSASSASKWLASNKPDLAIIDFGLRDGTSEELAEILAEMKIPFFVYSGTEYHPEEDHPLFSKLEWVSKPATSETLLSAIRRAVSGE